MDMFKWNNKNVDVYDVFGTLFKALLISDWLEGQLGILMINF